MPAENTITVQCACGKRLKAPASAAGKKGRCPACGAPMILSAPQPAAASPSNKITPPRPAPALAAAPVTVPPADPDDGLYDLVEPPVQAPSRVPAASVCPQCSASMDPQSPLCPACGFDTRPGKTLPRLAPPPALGASTSKKVVNYATPAARGQSPQKPVDYMAPQGSLLMGTLLSAAFALAASTVWIGFAWLTGLAIGYIGILIGIAAGMGMQIGQKGTSKNGGFIAAGMTLFAILVAKFVVLEIVLSRTGHTVPLSHLDPVKVGFYFLSPIGLIIIAVSLAAAFRVGSGSSR